MRVIEASPRLIGFPGSPTLVSSADSFARRCAADTPLSFCGQHSSVTLQKIRLSKGVFFVV